MGESLETGKDEATYYSYDDADELTQHMKADVYTYFTYDDDGNQTSKKVGDSLCCYNYEPNNMLTTFTDGTTDAEYVYDAFPGIRRRVKAVVDGAVTYYAFDGLNVLADYDGDVSAQRTFVVPFLDDSLVLRIGGNDYHYTLDALGSVANLVDGNEAVQNDYLYEAFGSAHGTPTQNLTQPFRFTGREWEGEPSLYYYRARNYAAGTGRFVQRDAFGRAVAEARGPTAIHSGALSRPRPSPCRKTAEQFQMQTADGPNLYLYCRSDPANRTDATGRLSKLFCLVACIPAGKFYFDCFEICGLAIDLAELEEWWNERRAGEEICRHPSAWQDCATFCPEDVSFERDCMDCCLIASQTLEQGQDDYCKCTTECVNKAAAIGLR